MYYERCLKIFQTLFETQKLLDLNISCKNKEIKAHLYILIVNSSNPDYYANLEKKEGFCHIDLSDFYYEDVDSLLQILYYPEKHFDLTPILIELANNLLIDLHGFLIKMGLDDQIENYGRLNETLYPNDIIENEIDNDIDATNNKNILFPKKKYNNYMKRYKKIKVIMKEIRLNKTSLAILSKTTNIPLSTLKRFKKKLRENPKFIPDYKKKGIVKQLLSPEIEKNVTLYLNTFVSKGIMLSRSLTIEKIREFLKNQVQLNKINPNILDNTFSFKWLRNFCLRNKFSFRAVRPIKRPMYSEIEIENYLNTVELLIQEYGADSIFNVDETRWNLNVPPKKILSKRGSQEVKGYFNGNIKTGFTVLATISASGEKIPLVVLAKGKNENILKRKYQTSNNDIIIIPSKSGWSCIDSMLEYLSYLVSYLKKDKIVLILDKYSSHNLLAQKVGDNYPDIKFLFIPAGATGILQPLDRKIFGIMKTNAAKKWLQKYIKDPNLKFTISDSVGILLETWTELSKTAILSAWDYKNVLHNNEINYDQSEVENDSEFILSEPSSNS